MSGSHRLRLVAGVLAVGALVLLNIDRGENLRGRRPTAAATVPAPDVLLAARVDEGSPPGQPLLFTDVTDASGVAGPVGSARLRVLPGTDAAADAEELAAASTFERVQATETYFASGQAWGDHDGDGDQDLYLTDPAGPNRLLDNDGSGHLRPSPMADDVAAVDQVSGPAVWVDYDDDGRPDLHVLGNGGDRLFHNDGDEGFSNVTLAAGIDDPGRGQAAAWADVDGDGNLDVYVADAGCQPCGPDPVPRRDRPQSRLFLSRGDGTFVDVTTSIRRFDGTRGRGMAAAWVDHDGDGDQDLYVVNDVGDDGATATTPGNTLLRNDGPGCQAVCFTDVSQVSGAGVRAEGHGLAVADLEGDGDPDLLVTNGGWRTGPTLLLENQGDGTFAEVGAARNADVGEWSWGAALVDVDADGDLDAILGTGLSERVLQAPAEDLTEADLTDPAALRQATEVAEPDGAIAADPQPRTDNTRVLLQGADGRFTTTLLGPIDAVAPVHQGVAVGDADGDGRPDVALGTIGAGYVLLADGDLDGHRTVVRLVGDGNRLPKEPAGSTVAITDDTGRTQTRTLRIDGGNDQLLRFAFGDARPTRVEIRWADGEVEVVDVDGSDRLLTVTADPYFAFPAAVTADELP